MENNSAKLIILLKLDICKMYYTISLVRQVKKFKITHESDASPASSFLDKAKTSAWVTMTLKATFSQKIKCM